MKKAVLKIMTWSALALIIPLLGNQFVDGWNWQWHDFIFAWVFWVLMATTILFVSKRAPKHRIAIGALIFIAFASVWVLLATG